MKYDALIWTPLLTGKFGVVFWLKNLNTELSKSTDVHVYSMSVN